MPKIIYSCDICGTVFQDEKAAENCEKEHALIISFKSPDYKIKKYDRKNRYPYSIICKMSDGKDIQYFRNEKGE